eukprot:tig00020816_g14135.t1
MIGKALSINGRTITIRPSNRSRPPFFIDDDEPEGEFRVAQIAAGFYDSPDGFTARFTLPTEGAAISATVRLRGQKLKRGVTFEGFMPAGSLSGPGRKQRTAFRMTATFKDLMEVSLDSSSAAVYWLLHRPPRFFRHQPALSALFEGISGFNLNHNWSTWRPDEENGAWFRTVNPWLSAELQESYLDFDDTICEIDPWATVTRAQGPQLPLGLSLAWRIGFSTPSEATAFFNLVQRAVRDVCTAPMAVPVSNSPLAPRMTSGSFIASFHRHVSEHRVPFRTAVELQRLVTAGRVAFEGISRSAWRALALRDADSAARALVRLFGTGYPIYSKDFGAINAK